MTIDEASKAKREAEDKIFQILSDFQQATGLQLIGLDVKTLYVAQVGEGAHRIVSSVSIDARV